MTYNVDWSVFTREEHDAINKLINMHERDNIACAVETMTREKEIELQKIVDHMKPLIVLDESKVRADYYKSHPNGPQTPAEEAELQAALDAEMKAMQEEQASKNQAQLAQMESAVKEEVTEEPKEEPVKELKAVPFCDTCDSRGVRHKRECPKLKA